MTTADTVRPAVQRACIVGVRLDLARQRMQLADTIASAERAGLAGEVVREMRNIRLRVEAVEREVRNAPRT